MDKPPYVVGDLDAELGKLLHSMPETLGRLAVHFSTVRQYLALSLEQGARAGVDLRPGLAGVLPLARTVRSELDKIIGLIDGSTGN